VHGLAATAMSGIMTLRGVSPCPALLIRVRHRADAAG
jgi:hypothetical protein